MYLRTHGTHKFVTRDVGNTMTIRYPEYRWVTADAIPSAPSPWSTHDSLESITEVS